MGPSWPTIPRPLPAAFPGPALRGKAAGSTSIDPRRMLTLLIAHGMHPDRTTRLRAAGRRRTGRRPPNPPRALRRVDVARRPA
jgi:hypothetical protein